MPEPLLENNPPTELRRLGVLGTGLLGGSTAAGARARGWEVIGFDADPQHLEAAIYNHLIDRPAASVGEVARQVDLLVLAVPVSRAAAVLREIASVAPESLIITDTLSTKRSIVRAADEILPIPQRFVGAHPMAGSDRSGPTAARANLFDGARCFLVDRPDWQADSRFTTALHQVRAFWHDLGCTMVGITAEAHDELVAAMSHLPQIVASALAGALTPDELGAGGAGLRDTTRIAASLPSLWRDILLDNRQPILDALGRFENQIAGFRHALEAGDAQAVETLLREASDRRRSTLPPSPASSKAERKVGSS